MSNQDIINLGKTVDQFGAAQQDMLDKLADAQQKALDAASNADMRVSALQSATSATTLYVSSAGDDGRSGATEGEAVRSWERLSLLLRGGMFNRVEVSGELVIDYFRYLTAPPSRILFVDKDNGSATLKDATNFAGFCGLWWEGILGVRFNIPVHLDAETAPHGLLNCSENTRHCNSYFNGGAFSQSNRNKAHLCFRGSGGSHKAIFAGSPVSAISGKVFNSVSAGQDPRTFNYIETNIGAA